MAGVDEFAALTADDIARFDRFDRPGMDRDTHEAAARAMRRAYRMMTDFAAAFVAAGQLLEDGASTLRISRAQDLFADLRDTWLRPQTQLFNQDRLSDVTKLLFECLVAFSERVSGQRPVSIISIEMEGNGTRRFVDV